MQAQITIEVGNLAVNYQGNQDFIEDGLLDIVKKVIDLSGDADLPLGLPAPSTDEVAGAQTATPSVGVQHVSTSTLASKMGASSGPDLIVAALGHLQLVKGQDVVQRQEIADQMKSATAYYKSTYVSNLTQYLVGLVKKGTINQIGDKTYALTAATREELESHVALS